MDVHAPEKPVLTVKEALAHLGIVTVGILIALSFEGIVEWSRHRSLVREARANLTQELKDNRERLGGFLATNNDFIKKLFHVMSILDDLSKPENVQEATSLFRVGNNPQHLIVGFVRVDLSADSRTTAEITGAFGFMDYDDVKRYAAAYDYQALYRRTQDQALDHLMAVTSGGLGLDFQKASPSQLEQLKDRLRLATGSVLAMTEFGQTLTSVYDTALREAD